MFSNVCLDIFYLKKKYMQKQITIAAMAAFLLLGIGCTKTDMLAEDLQSKDSPNLNVLSSIATEGCDVISFSNLQHGALISSVTSDGGVVVAMTSWSSRFRDEKVASMVFNSAQPEIDASKDIGTPNEKFEIAPGVYGPGKGKAGESGTYVNDVPMGNVMVIKDFSYLNKIVEDDVASWIAYDFGELKVTAKSITVLDVELSEGENANVMMYSSNGGEHLGTVNLSSTGQNGKEIKSLGDTKGVGYILVNLNGSMAMDDLRFCIETPPPPPPTGCTRTQGYWKTHGPSPKGNNKNEWDVTSMKLGNETYTADELLQIFNTQPKKGNGLVSLAHQLIAAKLNIANGAGYNDAVTKAIADADALIGDTIIPPRIGSGFISSAATSKLNDILTRYNEGKMGTSHCDD
jgi:hypothetical protein